MSETVDVNVLVYATDESSPRHAASQRAIEALATGPAPLYLFWPVVFGYLRVATLSAVAPRPLRTADAQRNIAELMARPNVRMAGEADRFWEIYRAVSADVTPRGNLVPDAHIVALMRQHGVGTIWTYDRDFRKFSGIRAREPA